jgi:endonuclease/exonuclease/phosphatase family metal-dependent hydrolase
VDVVGLQEVDQNQKRSGGISQITAVARALGAHDFCFVPAVTGEVDEGWKKRSAHEPLFFTNQNISEFSDAGYGIGMVSKIPVKDWHVLSLGKSLIGAPIAIPKEGGGARALYIRDEPRFAIAAEYDDGTFIANMHLSFVPIVNYIQLLKVQRWLRKLARKSRSKRLLIMGDMNMVGNIPGTLTTWNSLVKQPTYPSWKAKIQFDYFLTPGKKTFAHVRLLELSQPTISDHLPIGIELT